MYAISGLLIPRKKADPIPDTTSHEIAEMALNTERLMTVVVSGIFHGR